ncbi:MAG TPA: ABC transporter permease, partial [Candidatus Ventricola gallistercoris]|nr:ABC transporter permease [Candidatus Ventricola gallistercoris]
MNQKKNRVWLLLVLPGVLFVVFFMLIPLFSLCFAS